MKKKDAQATPLNELLDLLGSDDNWPKIEVLLRRATRVVANEMYKVSSSYPGQKIDVKSLVKDLGSGSLNAELQHFFTWNHRFIANLAEKNRRAAVDTYDFIDQNMPKAMFNPKQMDVIASKSADIMLTKGSILDLGVYKGASTRALASIFPEQTIHGFDSFEGLPEDWTHVTKGAFGDVNGMLPDMPANVKLYKGWFEDTLPKWFKTHNKKQISLLRVDCDLYSSTKTIFDVLGSLVHSGTWIVFDELIGYRGWQDHEHKAFSEFQEKSGIEFEYVAFGLTYAIGYVK